MTQPTDGYMISQLSESFNIPLPANWSGYAGSVDADLDQKVFEFKRLTDFWRDSVPREREARNALGNSAKSQANQQNQILGEAIFRPIGHIDGITTAVDETTGELIEIRDSKQGKSKRLVDPDQLRAERFTLQGVVAKLMPNSRTSKCLRSVQSAASGVQVHKSDEFCTCHYSGLQTCGSVWSCPVCAAKVAERRRSFELAPAIEAHTTAGGSVLLITYTVPHGREDDLKDMLKRLSATVATMKGHRNYKALRKILRQVGTVRALEVTHGANGWHPHIHELWLIDGETTLSHDDIKADLFTCWRRAAMANDFDEPSEKWGVDVQDGDFAAAYVAKWGHEPTQPLWTVDAELSKQVVKKAGRGGRSPFQLLADCAAGDVQAGRLFVEYSEAFRGARQLVWSRGLKERFGIGEISDEEISAIQEATAEPVASIPPKVWRKITRLELKQPYLQPRATILSLASRDWQLAKQFIIALVGYFDDSLPEKIAKAPFLIEQSPLQAN